MTRPAQRAGVEDDRPARMDAFNRMLMIGLEMDGSGHETLRAFPSPVRPYPATAAEMVRALDAYVERVFREQGYPKRLLGRRGTSEIMRSEDMTDEDTAGEDTAGEDRYVVDQLGFFPLLGADGHERSYPLYGVRDQVTGNWATHNDRSVVVASRTDDLTIIAARLSQVAREVLA